MTTIKSIEVKRLEEQKRLDSQKTSDERNRWGQFATPPKLAMDITRYARRIWHNRFDPIRFLDPAIGTGSFYSALCQVFNPDHIEGARGIELDAAFAETARRLWEESGLSIHHADFTKITPQYLFNLILTNPPYVRHHHLAQSDKRRLGALVREELGIEISGLAGLYCYFLLLCDKWLTDGGLAIWLIPSEFMVVNYGAAVRQYLTRKVKLIQIHQFSPSDVQFTDALVTSAVVVFEKSKVSPTDKVTLSFGGRL